MVWPSQLVTVALYETLHGGAKEYQQQTRDRMRFFLLAFVAIFVWQFLPSVIFPTLTSIATLCIIDNSSWVMRTLGSGYDGFGYLNFVSLAWNERKKTPSSSFLPAQSLDWSVIGGTGGASLTEPAIKRLTCQQC